MDFEKLLEIRPRYLNLSNKVIELEEIKKLSEVLRNNTTLERLHISKIGNEGIKELSKGLRNNTTLRNLYVINNNIGLDGIKELCKVLLQSNNTLVSLDLGYNNIRDVSSFAS